MKTEVKIEKKNDERNFVALHIAWIAICFAVVSFLALQEAFDLKLIDLDFHIKWPWGKKAQPEVVIQKKIYSSEQFVLLAAKKADSLRIEKPTKIFLGENEAVSETSTKFAVVEPFKEIWSFSELKPILKQFPLTVKPIFESGSSLLVPYYRGGYTEFIRDYEEVNKFKIDPRPKYIIYFDGKICLSGQSGKLWNRRY